jgi:hypothetical protein
VTGWLRQLLLGLSFGAACFAFGRCGSTPPVKSTYNETSTSTATKATATESKTVTKPFRRTKRNHATVTKPDGTIETKTDTITESGAEIVTGDKTSTVAGQVQAKSIVKPVELSLPRYSLGVFAGTNTQSRLMSVPPSYGVSAGLRLVGGAWVKAQVDVPNRAATVGLEYQF